MKYREMIYKNIMILVMLLEISTGLSAQIGIGTEAPGSLFHIDSRSDTDSSAPVSGGIADDIVFENGQLGLGTLTPSRTLDLKNSFRYSDGNETVDYILYADDHKNINWAMEKPIYPPLINVPASVMDAAFSGLTFPANSVDIYKYSGVSLTLTKGIWLLYLKTRFTTWWGGGIDGNMRALISSSSTGNGLSTSEGALTSSASTNGGAGFFSGYVFLSVTQPSKTYYLWLGYISSRTTIAGPQYDSAKAEGINSFYAIRYSHL